MTCIVAKIAYGYTIRDDNDPFAILIDKVGELLHNSGPIANTPVDFFPWCKRISDFKDTCRLFLTIFLISSGSFPLVVPRHLLCWICAQVGKSHPRVYQLPIQFHDQPVGMYGMPHSSSSWLIRKKSEGKAQPSFVSKYLGDLEIEDIEDPEDYIKDIKQAAAQVYVAGVDTVSCSDCN